jgi:hypothetical protein
MEPKLGVLIIHGVGWHKEGFADQMKEELITRISYNEEAIRWQEVLWGKELTKQEDHLVGRLFKKEKPPHWFEEKMSLLLRVFRPEEKLPRWVKEKCSLQFEVRELVMNGIGDVVAYRSIKDEIHRRVHQAIFNLKEQLSNQDKPVIVIAHSLGSVIMFEYIRDRQNHLDEGTFGDTPLERMETLAGFITFGSPIPIFTVGSNPVQSITFPPKYLPGAKWMNFYDTDDLFGWPLRNLSKSYEACKYLEDKPINVGFTPLCHKKYWTNDKFTEPVAKYISEILEVCHQHDHQTA